MKNKIQIIAEIGVNHNGSTDLAKKMIDAAISSGATAVKFQTFRAETLVDKNTPNVIILVLIFLNLFYLFFNIYCSWVTWFLVASIHCLLAKRYNLWRVKSC